MAETPIRLRLEERHFRDLVAGKVATLLTVEDRPVEIILADIGWGRMRAAIEDAIATQRRRER